MGKICVNFLHFNDFFHVPYMNITIIYQEIDVEYEKLILEPKNCLWFLKPLKLTILNIVCYPSLFNGS